MKKIIWNLGGKIADFDPQSGVTGWVMHMCWKIGNPERGLS